MAELSTATSKNEFLNRLQMVISKLKDKEEDSVGSSHSFAPLNKDDFMVLLMLKHYIKDSILLHTRRNYYR